MKCLFLGVAALLLLFSSPALAQGNKCDPDKLRAIWEANKARLEEKHGCILELLYFEAQLNGSESGCEFLACLEASTHTFDLKIGVKGQIWEYPNEERPVVQVNETGGIASSMCRKKNWGAGAS